MNKFIIVPPGQEANFNNALKIANATVVFDTTDEASIFLQSRDVLNRFYYKFVPISVDFPKNIMTTYSDSDKNRNSNTQSEANKNIKPVPNESKTLPEATKSVQIKKSNLNT